MSPTLFSKVFQGLAFFLVLFYSFWLGIDVQRGDTKEIIADAIMLGFWLFALAFFAIMNRQERKLNRELDEAHKNLHHALGDVFSELERDMKEQKARRDAFTTIFKEVTGKKFEDAKSVSAKHKATIERRFHEVTGKYARIEVKKDGVIGVEVSDKPATKKAPVKKSVAKKTVEQLPKPPVVKKSNAKKKGNK